MVEVDRQEPPRTRDVVRTVAACAFAGQVAVALVLVVASIGGAIDIPQGAVHAIAYGSGLAVLGIHVLGASQRVRLAAVVLALLGTVLGLVSKDLLYAAVFALNAALLVAVAAQGAKHQEPQPRTGGRVPAART